MRDKLKIVCSELVSMPSGNGIYQQVIFKPNKRTVADIREAVRTNEWYNLEVKDGSKVNHVSNRPHRFLAARAERTVLVVTTQEL